MTEINYLKDVQIAASKDGSGIILAGATENKGVVTIAFQAKDLGRIVSDLLRLGAQPEVESHAKTKQAMQPGTLREIRPFRIEAISVGIIPVLPTAVLMIDFPAIDRISIAISADESDQLIQQLKETVQKVRATARWRNFARCSCSRFMSVLSSVM